LLVEDETTIRQDHKEELERLGYLIVGETGDGVEGVNLARELRPDLVIMCIRLPGMDGISAAEILTRERIAPVMLVTAMNADELVERADAAGVVMYITKPWRTRDMRPAIEMALARYRERMALERQGATLEDALVTRRVVEQASAILRKKYGLTVERSYRKISMLALHNRKSLRDVAEAIVLVDELSTAIEDTKEEGPPQE